MLDRIRGAVTKNWKTSASAVLGVLLLAAAEFGVAPSTYEELTQGGGVLALAVGLLFARDGDKDDAGPPDPGAVGG